MHDEDLFPEGLQSRSELVRESQNRFRAALATLAELVHLPEDEVQPLLLARLELSRSIRERRRHIIALQMAIGTSHPAARDSTCRDPIPARLEDKTTPHFSAWTAMMTALDRLAYSEALSGLVPDLIAASELEISSLMVSAAARVIDDREPQFAGLPPVKPVVFPSAALADIAHNPSGGSGTP